MSSKEPEMTTPITSVHAAPATLAKAMGGAAVAAALVLTLFVLPAEAGIDPTGAGRVLGLTAMASPEPADEAAVTAVPAAPAQPGLPTQASIARSTAMRSDEMTLTLAPHSGAEIKTHMAQGDSFVFQWTAKGGPLKVDMHGEHPDAADGVFTSYWKDKAMTGAQGDFTAPFAGTHGWYWRNKGEVPVTVTVRTTGFYKDMFRPDEG